jgi:hypothetical protein
MTDEWEIEEEDEDSAYQQHEANGGDLSSFWDVEAGWIKDVHLKSLDELQKIGYPDVHISPNKTELSTGEKALGTTGLDITPYGLVEIWRDIADSWNMSVAKIQRISTCHGICIFAKDENYVNLQKLYRKTTRLIRGSTDPKMLDALEDSALTYLYNPKRAKKGGSVSFLTNRLGAIAKIQHTLGLAQTQTLCELSIASIMTIKSRELGKWKLTLAEEYKGFNDHKERRKVALEVLYQKLTKFDQNL